MDTRGTYIGRQPTLEKPFTAADAIVASAKAKELDGDIARQELPKVFAAIKKAAGEGARSCYMPPVQHDGIVRQQLINLGYEIKFYGGDSRDPPDHSYYVISW